MTTKVKDLMEALAPYADKDLSLIVSADDNWTIKNSKTNNLSLTHAGGKCHDTIELVFNLGEEIEIIVKNDDTDNQEDELCRACLQYTILNDSGVCGNCEEAETQKEKHECDMILEHLVN